MAEEYSTPIERAASSTGDVPFDQDANGGSAWSSSRELDAVAANRAQINRLAAFGFTAILGALLVILGITGFLVSADAVPAETFTQAVLVVLGMVSAMAGSMGTFTVVERARSE